MAVVNTLKQILYGWSNYFFKNSEIEKLAAKRIVLCFNCTDLRKTNNTCKLCGCWVPAKVRSKTSSCPAKKW